MVSRRQVGGLVLAVVAAGAASPASAYISNRLFFQYERAKADRAAGLAGRPAQATTAAPGAQSSRYHVTRPGVPVKVRWYYSMQPTCVSLGRPVVNLVSGPQGGQVYSRGAMEFPTYPATNVRFACDRRRAAATDVMYRPRPDFLGSDSFTVEVVFPDGMARQDTFAVSVR